MAVIGLNSDTLLSGLSSFWQTMFADKEQLSATYAATETLLGQAYLDILTEVLNTNLDDTPLFNKEYWHLQVFRKDRMAYVPGSSMPYRFSLEGGLKDFRFLLNSIYNPTLAWEKGIDFEITSTDVCFKIDPFAQALPGVASRRAAVLPVTYREGRDGEVLPATPRVFHTTGLIRRGTDARAYGNSILKSTTANFKKSDIGRLIKLVPPGGAIQVRKIKARLDSETVELDDIVAATSDITWQVHDEKVFFPHHVGNAITIKDPTSPAKSATYGIVSVDPLGLAVTVDRDIDTYNSHATSMPWSMDSTGSVPELSFWVPDAMFDRENLFLSFGYLINRYEPSSESYRYLIKGIFQLFLLGPALRRIEAALNVMVGLPVARESGEVVLRIDERGGRQVLVTSRYDYEVPLGSLRKDLIPGYTLQAFETLTHVFTVTDSTKDPQWFYGKTIPPALIANNSVVDRAIDPQLYGIEVGSSKAWYIGNPHTYLGADETGDLPPTIQGRDGFLWVTGDGRLYSPSTKFKASLQGTHITVEDKVYTVNNVGLDATQGAFGYVELDATPQELMELESRMVVGPGSIPFHGYPIFRFPAASFDALIHVGGTLQVSNASDPLHNGIWEITQVIDAHTVRVTIVEYETPATPTFPVGTTLSALLGLSWSVQTRLGMTHNVGYHLFKDYLNVHTCMVSYDFNLYDIPYPRSREDIQDVILAGKPAHVYMLINAAHSLDDDFVTVTDGRAISLAPREVIAEVDPTLTIGDGWHVGTLFKYTNQFYEPFNVIRASEQGSVVELLGSGQADYATLIAYTGGGSTSYIRTEIHAWNGVGFTPTGDVLHLGPSTGIFVANINTLRNRVAVRMTAVGGTADANLVYGYRSTKPGIILTAEGATPLSQHGEIGNNGDDFTDTTVTFHASDLYRCLDVDVQGVVQCYIKSINSPHSVTLHKRDGTGRLNVPPASGIQWWLGTPQRTATAVVVGGGNPKIERGEMVDWPAQVLFS